MGPHMSKKTDIGNLAAGSGTGFGGSADRYEARIDWGARLKRELPFVCRHLGAPGARGVLDAGCGPGHHVLALQSRGYRIVSGGSDNHLFLVDLRHFDTMTGLAACEFLDEAGITINQNLIPFDPRSARETSGVRIGTPAVTTRGMQEPEMVQIADWIDQVLRSPEDGALRRRIRDEVEQFCLQFPIYPGLSGMFLPELTERVGT